MRQSVPFWQGVLALGRKLMQVFFDSLGVYTLIVRLLVKPMPR